MSDPLCIGSCVKTVLHFENCALCFPVSKLHVLGRIATTARSAGCSVLLQVVTVAFSFGTPLGNICCTPRGL